MGNGKPANSSSKVTLYGNFLARKATQPTHLIRVITAKPRGKVDIEIFSRAVQRVSRQFDAPSGPSPSGGSLSFTCQPTGEMHSKSLRFQGSPLVPPSLGGATHLGPTNLGPNNLGPNHLGQNNLGPNNLGP